LRRFASICSSIVDAIVRGGVVRARGSVLLCDAAEMRAGFLNSEKTYCTVNYQRAPLNCLQKFPLETESLKPNSKASGDAPRLR
jgi:hypothetical protein